MAIVLKILEGILKIRDLFQSGQMCPIVHYHQHRNHHDSDSDGDHGFDLMQISETSNLGSTPTASCNIAAMQRNVTATIVFIIIEKNKQTIIHHHQKHKLIAADEEEGLKRSKPNVPQYKHCPSFTIEQN